jgi:adenosylmethionine-8-amino-7-oxononanoate aminotransferase
VQRLVETGKEFPLDVSFVFPRRLDKRLPQAAKAKGAWIEAEDGKRYLDACGGALVVNVGHGREEIAQAVAEQMKHFSYVHGTLFTSRPLEELAGRLADHAPSGLSRFYFMCSGSEAVETAIKLARQVHLECGRPSRTKLISRWKSYHGLTLGALAASGRTYFRQPFAALLPEVVHIPPPYCLRCSYGLTFPTCSLRCALALEETILSLGEETVSAFIAEPVSGAALGVYPPPPGYLRLIREICDLYGVFLIFDEIMSGMGRTGRWFAAQHEDVVPDLMTLGKGLSSGALPLSAVAARPEHMDVIRRGSGNFVHGGTYSHHAVGAAAALAVIGILERENLVQRAAEMGTYLGDQLKRKVLPLPYVLDVRGMGLMWGVELGQNKEQLTPFPRARKVTERIREAMFDRGVLVYPSTGFAGKDGDAIIFGPPFTIETSEIDLAVDTLVDVLEKILGRNQSK